MNSEYDDFINELQCCLRNYRENNNQLPIVLDKIFAKSNLVEESKIDQDNSSDEGELSNYKFDDYLKEVFNQLEQTSPSQFEYNCKCLLSVLLNQEITSELKQSFFQHIIAWLSFMQVKIREELNKNDNDLNQNEIISVMMVHIFNFL
ncbi:hypothetical protein LY90DRAFT_507992 [Neocallimastix californiae]|uniref:Uncharacterized protein n=1 Tax=Neocallimastix californiae TaxID=1754190 RepID=A0A1Y2D3V8_9FUNG|nr:hypothetical protein LY90DRAFT_507992 [Neocallimastix californiae]|eukprot:ORY53969.1 hypothetical protein LY90DRAFT_507992 [Neocallimastix californiae]